MSITGAQIRMARAALCLSMGQMQEVSGISERTLRRIECANGAPKVSKRTLARLQAFYERHGLIFLEEDGYGVKLAYDPNALSACRGPETMQEIAALLAR